MQEVDEVHEYLAKMPKDRFNRTFVAKLPARSRAFVAKLPDTRLKRAEAKDTFNRRFLTRVAQ